MRRLTTLFSVAAVAALFAAPSISAASNDDVQLMTEREQAVSSQLASILAVSDSRLDRVDRGIDYQVARRGYGHHPHYGHHRGHDHRHYHRSWHGPQRHYWNAPYRTYYRPYYGYGSGIYYSRPGISIGFGF